jgi:hypothetical protein
MSKKLMTVKKFKVFIQKQFPKLLGKKEVSGFEQNYKAIDRYGNAIIKIRDDERIYGWIFIDVYGKGHGYLMNQKNPNTKCWKPFHWNTNADLKVIIKELSS